MNWTAFLGVVVWFAFAPLAFGLFNYSAYMTTKDFLFTKHEARESESRLGAVLSMFGPIACLSAVVVLFVNGDGFGWRWSADD